MDGGEVEKLDCTAPVSSNCERSGEPTHVLVPHGARLEFNVGGELPDTSSPTVGVYEKGLVLLHADLSYGAFGDADDVS